MARQNAVSQLFNEILKTVETVGTKNTISLLRSRSSVITPKQNELIGYIIDKSCAVFNISKKELTCGNSNGDRKQARSICIYIIREYVKIKYDDISPLFNHISKAEISRNINYVVSLDEMNITDKAVINKKNKIEQELNAYLKRITQ